MAVVHQFVAGFNKGDAKMLSSACSDQVSIIDEFPPYEWHGTGSCAKWSRKPVREVGSIFTIALQQSSAGWRITGWAWAKH